MRASSYLSSSFSSGTASDSTEVTRSPLLASMSTKPSYWASVRGKPSSRNPLAQSSCHEACPMDGCMFDECQNGRWTSTWYKKKKLPKPACIILSAMMPITISLLTSPPASMTAFACFPISVPAATAPALVRVGVRKKTCFSLEVLA